MWQLARWHGQPAMGGATSLCIASVSQGIVDMAARSRMSREVHVRSLWGTGGEIPPVYPASPRCEERRPREEPQGPAYRCEAQGRSDP